MRRTLKQFKEEVFNNHKAEVITETPDVSVYRFCKHSDRGTPLSSYFLEFIIRFNTLYVSGDLGFSVFRWSEPISLDFLGQCDIGYLIGKCEASSVGRDFTHWYEDVAQKNLLEVLDNWGEHCYVGDEYNSDELEVGWEDLDRETKNTVINKQLKLIDENLNISRLLNNCENEREFYEYVHGINDPDLVYILEDVSGKDYHNQSYHQYYGLQLMIEQLKNKEVT